MLHFQFAIQSYMIPQILIRMPNGEDIYDVVYLIFYMDWILSLYTGVMANLNNTICGKRSKRNQLTLPYFCRLHLVSAENSTRQVKIVEKLVHNILSSSQIKFIFYIVC